MSKLRFSVAVAALAAALALDPALAASKGKFALVLSGPAADNSWNAAALNAMKALQAKGYEVAMAEDVQPPDAPRVLREFADKGFQMIVAHSFGYQDAVMEVAQEFPKVNFAWAGGINGVAKNVADYDQPFYDAAYLVGIVAAHVAKNKKIGALYGFDIPVCHAMGEAALAGAKTIAADTQLLSAASGDWNDVAKAKEAALAQSEAGVDFWIECGQAPAFGAIAAAKDKGGYATGYVGDMSADGANEVLVSLIWKLEPLFQKMLDDALAGSFNAPYYRFGIKEGALDIAINPKLADKIPPAALAKVEEAKAKIKSGEFTVPYVPK